MRRNGQGEAMVLLVVLMAVVGAGGQAWGAGARPVLDVERPNPTGATALASGAFRCDVFSVDPPNGPGIPQGSASIEFNAYLGLTGTNVYEGVYLGSGAGINEACQAFADQMSSRARGLGCVASPIRFVETVGGNYTQKEWSSDIICVNQANGVVAAVGALLLDIVTAPGAQLQRTDLEPREPDFREGLRTPLPSMRQRLPADR